MTVDDPLDQRAEPRPSATAGAVADLSAAARPDRSAWYVLGLLAAAQFFANIDRSVFGLLLEPIKRDLKASDTEMAFLSGMAFTVSFILFSIPLARWTDVGVRRTILAVCVFAWSLAAGLTSAAGSVLQMGLARAGLGIAEAGAQPTSMSMLGDLFPRAWRHRATGLMFMGNALPPLVGLPAVALLSGAYGWRIGLLVPAVLGGVLGLLIAFTVKEPRRGRYDENFQAEEPAPPVMMVLKLIGGHKALVLHLLSHVLAAAALTGIITWTTAYLIRGHEFSMAQVAAFGAVSGVTVLAAIPAGAWICSWLTARTHDDRAAVAFCAAASLIGAVALAVGLATPATAPFLVLVVLANVFICLRGSPVMALAAEMAQPRMRGMVIALMTAGGALIGGALAPMVTGIVSDRLAPQVGASEALRWALLLTLPTFLAGSAAFGFWSLRHLPRRAGATS